MLARADADSKSKMASGSSPGGRAPPAASSSSSWDVALATRAVRDAEAGPAREAALLYLATLAEAHPEGVLSHVLDVSAALADVASDDAGGGERDDALSRKALERALAAVVPAWISGGLGVAEAAAKVVDALPDVPPHRRATLCVALLDACPDKREGLPRTLTSLLARADALETAAREKAARRARRAKRRAEKEAPGRVREEAIATAEMEERAARESTAWVMDLAAGLLAREPATTAVDALAATMRVRRARERSERLFRRRGRFSSCRFYVRNPNPNPNPRKKEKKARVSGAARVSLMINLPCQDSDELRHVELRVDTPSSAAFLLRDARGRSGSLFRGEEKTDFPRRFFPSSLTATPPPPRPPSSPRTPATRADASCGSPPTSRARSSPRARFSRRRSARRRRRRPPPPPPPPPPPARLRMGRTPPTPRRTPPTRSRRSFRPGTRTSPRARCT